MTDQTVPARPAVSDAQIDAGVHRRPLVGLSWAMGDRTVVDEARARLAAGNYPDDGTQPCHEVT